MDAISLILGLVIVAVAAYLVGAPLLRPAGPEPAGVDETDAEELLEREKESVFGTLAEIEFDYRMHKLDEADYQALKNKYQQQAVRVLQQEESELGTPASPRDEDAGLDEGLAREIETEIEQELERLRREKGK